MNLNEYNESSLGPDHLRFGLANILPLIKDLLRALQLLKGT